MKIRVEVHTHTNFSHDSMLNKWLYLFMLKIKKINVVGITDHNEIQGAIKFKKFLNRFGIKVIVGEEIFTTDGEIIGLFLNQRIEPGLSPQETIRRIKNQGGIVYIPHPYDEKRYRTVLSELHIDENCDYIDIIEVHNGRNIKTFFSEKQLEIAERYNKIHCVGSDAHTFLELGRNYVLMDAFNDEFDFINKLKTAVLVKKPCMPISHQITKMARLIKLLKKGDFNGIFRIIYKRYNKIHNKSS